jgi:hypothetical protein
MSRKSRARKNQSSSPKSLWPWLAGIGVLLLVVGGVVVWALSRPGSTAVTPQVEGAPKLVVDQTLVDEGYLQYNVPVRTTYRLSNVGDRPLKIVGQPTVELVEGC